MIDSDLRQMARYYYSIMEGDTHLINDAFKFMREKGLIDEDGYLINEEDEE